MVTRQQLQSVGWGDRDCAAYHAGVRPKNAACVELNLFLRR